MCQEPYFHDMEKEDLILWMTIVDVVITVGKCKLDSTYLSINLM